MTIGRDYPHPIIVNGFQCRNCDDVSDAKRNIDPAKSNFDPLPKQSIDAIDFADSSFTFGGSLASRMPPILPASDGTALGRLIDQFA